jgi:hypothetical protein
VAHIDALGGGIGWSGATTCVNGYTCTFSNDYYSQCVPGSAGTTQPGTTTKTTAPTTAAPTTSKPTATSAINYWYDSSDYKRVDVILMDYYRFSFGDSYTSTGFNINGVQPSVGNPLGNPTYPVGQRANAG